MTHLNYRDEGCKQQWGFVLESGRDFPIKPVAEPASGDLLELAGYDLAEIRSVQRPYQGPDPSREQPLNSRKRSKRHASYINI